PQADLITSRYFFQSGSFFISSNPYWITLRDYHRLSQWYLLLFIIVLIMVYALWSKPLSAIAPHKLAYITLTYVLGPGVLVHGLKLRLGRARPRIIMEFGGSADFTPAWQLAGACHHNCSFPSGEASAAAAMLPLLILVPMRYRLKAAAILVPILVLISLNRVFMGAHFLSDIVIAWTLVFGVILWLWPRVLRHADAIDGWCDLGGRAFGRDCMFAD